jgi:hypothetical protein
MRLRQMPRVADDRTTRDVLSSDSGRSIIAHLRGGPFDGKQFVLYRARQYYTPRVRRGTLRRALRMSRRYAWYEVGRTWEEDEVLHGEYDFLGIGPKSEPLERAAYRAG